MCIENHHTASELIEATHILYHVLTESHPSGLGFQGIVLFILHGDNYNIYYYKAGVANRVPADIDMSL